MIRVEGDGRLELVAAFSGQRGLAEDAGRLRRVAIRFAEVVVGAGIPGGLRHCQLEELDGLIVVSRRHGCDALGDEWISRIRGECRQDEEERHNRCGDRS